MRLSQKIRLGLLFILGMFVFVVLGQKVLAQNVADIDTEEINIKRNGQELRTRVVKELTGKLGKPVRSGSIIVKFKGGSNLIGRTQSHLRAGAKATENLFLKDTVRVQVSTEKVAQALETYKNDPNVEYVSEDGIVKAVSLPNDPRFSEQWGITKINAPSAWDISKGLSNIRIAILDCGIYDSASSLLSSDGKKGHPDVRNKVISRINFTTSRNTDDYCNHGTHVAGIASATTNNGVGVAGAGYNASIANVKVLADNGSGTFGWIINGVLWAAGCDTNPCGQRRAEVINMSLGSIGSCDPLVQAAIDKAWGQGLVIVAAGGNNNTNGAITPANCNNVIGVGASDQNDNKANFSNYGNDIDVAAPGVSILSGNYVGGYSYFSGTSMASPFVAGEAGLLLATSYGSNNQTVVERIFQSANNSYLAGSIHGRIDLEKSVTGSSPNPTVTPTATLTPTPTSSISPTPTNSPTSIPTPTSTPTSAPTPTPILNSCTAPVIVSKNDTSPSGGGTVSFSWNPINGATNYRIQRQVGNLWIVVLTTSNTSFSGVDSFTDPNWRVYVNSGTCTPIPGPAIIFDP